ncbi:hypothetical protein [Radiobacillus sp. PE A8.2]|uniref:hypothetical protein n=1 Tax=Radiobacillus sp. PE A8.2 TaxID=3380349 RepID=UPI00388D29F7
MSLAENRFLEELDQELGNYPNKQEILSDYQLHIYEITQEQLLSDDHEQYIAFQQRLGSPSDIAKLWKQEANVTPGKMQTLFVAFNICLFAGGGLLTWAYHALHWSWLVFLWRNLTRIPSIIILVYFVFWGLLGYEIGKEFGPRGKKILRNTFIICVVPNLILMYLIVFRLIPYEWFQPLLSFPFIISCIGFTVLLYPVSWIGYRWGRRDSV